MYEIKERKKKRKPVKPIKINKKQIKFKLITERTKQRMN